MIEEQSKKCCVCKEILPFSAFSPHRRMTLKLQPQCKKCGRIWHGKHPEYVKEKNILFYQKNPTYRRDYRLRTKYGITFEIITALIKKQRGKCPGCNRKLEDVKMCVDHCHSTKRVRGLLCNDCSLSLGYVKDNPQILRRLAKYVTTKEEAMAHA